MFQGLKAGYATAPHTARTAATSCAAVEDTTRRRSPSKSDATASSTGAASSIARLAWRPLTSIPASNWHSSHNLDESPNIYLKFVKMFAIFLLSQFMDWHSTREYKRQSSTPNFVHKLKQKNHFVLHITINSNITYAVNLFAFFVSVQYRN